MNLTEYLNFKGVTKTFVAEELGISKAAVSAWKEIPEKHLDKLMKVPVQIPMKEKVKNWNEYTVDEVWEICKRRGCGIDGVPQREFETDYEIAHSLGLKVFEFHRMIKKYVQEKGHV